MFNEPGFMGDTEKLYRAIIGFKNTGYYLNYFERADTRGYTPVSWNWPAFFIGFFWLIYRKHYTWALLFIAVTLGLFTVSAILSGLIGEESAATLQVIALLGFQNVWFPLHANGLYYKWAQKEIDKARTANQGQLDAQIDQLVVTGGVNISPLFLFMVLLMLILSITSGLTPTT